jgi:c-di-GMP-binding flagellar brake protein YcgR
MNRSAQINMAQIIRQATSAESEKRKHLRLSLRLPMEYSFPESSHLRLAYMVDICEGGLLMYAPENLDIGQNLSFKFYYDSAAGLDYIQTPGEVIRVDRLGISGKEYRCAVRFSDLPADFLKKLRKFLKSLY